MTARAKIEQLTNTWYGFAVFSAAASFLMGERSIGLFSIFFAAVGLCLSWALTWFIGRRLLAKSSLTRAILLVVSGLSVFFGSISAGKSALAFIHAWDLGLLATAAYAAAGAWINAKSFRTLTDSSVKAYFN